MRDTDHNYPKLLRVAQVIREQEKNDSRPSMTWDSDSGPSSNLAEQSHSFLCTKLAQGDSGENSRLRTEFQITRSSVTQKSFKENFISGLRVDTLCVEPNSFAISFPDIIFISLFLEILCNLCGQSQCGRKKNTTHPPSGVPSYIKL